MLKYERTELKRMGKISENPKLRDKMSVFKSRSHAGEALAEKLEKFGGSEAWVLAIPAGGVPVGVILSEKLGLRFDLILVRKIHIPWNPEAGFGALAWDGTVFYNEPLLRTLGLIEEEVERCVAAERAVIVERMRLFRGDRPFPELRGKTAILVDDGMASGFSMLAAAESVRRRNPREVVVAVPTGSEGAVQLVGPHADELICLNIRSGPTFAVADAYRAWHDLDEEDVVKILSRHKS